MGTLDYLRRGSARPGITRRPSLLSAPARFTPPRLIGGGGRELKPPERFDVNKTFDDLSDSGAGIFATAGMLPARAMETPVSLADTASRLLTGGRINNGKAVGGFSPVQALGQTPLGAVGGFLGEATERSGNFIPSLINSTDANIWKAVGDLPDNTPITDELVRDRLEAMGESSLFAEGEKTEGVPILGALPFLRHTPLGGRAKTVGELRDELNKRGFFYDENTGQPIDPVEMVQNLRSGRTSTFNFGYAATNDNGLVDVLTRVTTDPSNALFFIPGGALAKIGAAGTRLLPAARLARAGAIAERAPRAITSATAIMRGDRTQATLAGVARALKGYRSVAIASTVASYGVNTAAGAINNLADDELPFITEIRDFTGAVNEARPMSGNSAFMLLGAATFPYGQYAKSAASGVRNIRNRVVGVEDMGAFHREYGGRAKFEEEFGGPEGVNELAGFLDVQIVRDLGKITDREAATFRNLGSMSLRRKFEQMALQRVVDRARKNGEITADMRLAKFQEFHAQQGGFKEHGIANPWDAARAARRWRAWQPVRKTIQPILDDTGEVIWGLRDDVIFVEQIDATRTNLKAAVYKDAKGVKRISRQDLLDVLEDNPNLNSLDTTGKWSKWATGQMDPTWDSVSRKLSHQKRDAVKIDDYTAELTQWESKAPPDIEAPDRVPRQQRIADLRDELNATYDADGVIRPELLDESQRIQKLLEDELAQENGVHWARTAEFDRKNGTDPEVGRGLNEAIEADDLIAPPRLSPGLDKFDEATTARVAALEAEVIKINPSYRLKRAPEKDAILALVPEDGALSVALRHRRATAEWLFETGPLSPLSNFWHTLTRKVTRDELGNDAKQALMNELIPLGVEPKKVTRILDELHEHIMTSGTISKGGFQARTFRDIGSIPPTQVNRIVRRTLNYGQRKGVEHKALAQIEAKGGFYRILAKTGSRYARSLSSKAAKGDRGAKVLRTIYDIWNDSKLTKDLATVQRQVAKYYYPMFRFLADPRWIGLNMSEATVLSLAKDGYVRAAKSLDDVSPAARRFTLRDRGLDAPDVGLFFGRELDLHIAKSFDVRAPKSVMKVIDEMGESNPTLREIRRNMRMEGEIMLQKAQRDLDAGDITQRQYDAEAARAQRLQDGGKQAMSEHLNETLYGFETKGVEPTIVDEARKVLRADEIQVLRDSGMLDRLVEVNNRTWDDVRRMFHGNPERSTLERLANSYWLYWPISYQIKATKWLTDIMLNGSFGQNNNALLAGRYAVFQQEHNERMTNNPAYAAMMASHPTLWFASQMLLPMSPEDIGVSMGRGTRLAATHGQNFLNEWLGTDIGVFTAEKQSEDMASAIAWLTNMGPTYTAEMAARLYNEADDVRVAPRPAPQITPTPSTGLPSLSVR